MIQKYHQKVALLCLFAIGGCHHVTASNQGWSDDTYISLMETGSDMVDTNRIQAAIPFYEQSLERALQAGDTGSIEISAYNLGLAQLRNNDSVSSLKTVKQAQVSLAQHGISKPSLHLALIEGAALNSQNKWQASQAVLFPCLKASDTEIKTQALYIQGLNDSALTRFDALQKDINEITLIPVKNAIEDENEEELKIRSKILKGDYKSAEKEAKSLVLQRRINHEYSPMRDALSLEAEALERSGDSKKAHNIRLQIIESQKASIL